MPVSAIDNTNPQSAKPASLSASSAKVQQTQAPSKPRTPAADTVKISTAAKALQRLTPTSTQTSAQHSKKAAPSSPQAERPSATKAAK